MIIRNASRAALPALLLCAAIAGCGATIEAESDASKTPSPKKAATPALILEGPTAEDGVKGGDATSLVAVAASRPDPDPDKPEDIAALKKLGFEHDTDAYGRVTEINFQKKKATDKALALILRFKQLEVLILDKTGVSNAQLSGVKAFKKLTQLSLEENAITDDGLAHLKDMKGLEFLSLVKTKITGKGLNHIKGLTNLRVLNLSYCNIGDSSLQYLTDMKLLETLALQKANLKGSGLKHIGKLKNMITLNLDGSSIEGLSLLHLKPCQKMRIIYLRDSFVSKRSVNKLEENISSLAIFQ